MSHLHRQQPGRCSMLGNNTQHTFMHNKDQFAANSSRYRLLSHQLHVTGGRPWSKERKMLGVSQMASQLVAYFMMETFGHQTGWWHTLLWKHLDIILFPMLLLLSEILCLMKLDTFGQPLHLKPFWRSICLKPNTASKFSTTHTHNLFLNYFSVIMCCVVCVCACARTHTQLLHRLLLSFSDLLY